MGVPAAAPAAVLPEILREGLELVELGRIANGRSLSCSREKTRFRQLCEMVTKGGSRDAQMGLNLPGRRSFPRSLHHGPNDRDATRMGQGFQLPRNALEGGVGVAHEALILKFLK